MESCDVIPVHTIQNQLNIQLTSSEQKVCSTNSKLNLIACTDNVAATNQCHGPKQILGSIEVMVLVQFLMENPGAYLDELQIELYKCAGLQCSMATLF